MTIRFLSILFLTLVLALIAPVWAQDQSIITKAVATSASHSSVSSETLHTYKADEESAHRIVKRAKTTFIVIMLAIGGLVGLILLYVFIAWIMGW